MLIYTTKIYQPYPTILWLPLGCVSKFGTKTKTTAGILQFERDPWNPLKSLSLLIDTKKRFYSNLSLCDEHLDSYPRVLTLHVSRQQWSIQVHHVPSSQCQPPQASSRVRRHNQIPHHSLSFMDPVNACLNTVSLDPALKIKVGNRNTQDCIRNLEEIVNPISGPQHLRHQWSGTQLTVWICMMNCQSTYSLHHTPSWSWHFATNYSRGPSCSHSFGQKNRGTKETQRTAVIGM